MQGCGMALRQAGTAKKITLAQRQLGKRLSSARGADDQQFFTIGHGAKPADAVIELKTSELCGLGPTASTPDSANKTTPFANPPRITQALFF
jgi:hypothetical protein